MKKEKKNNEITVKVWDAKLVKGGSVKVVTIEQGPRKESMCEGCSAPCCRGMFKPVLTSEEFLSKKFPTAYQELPFFLGIQGVKADYIVTLNVPETGCPYFDSETKKCTIWPNCPASCKAYDCRDDIRPEIKAFVKKRKKEWRKEQAKRKRLKIEGN